MKVLTAPLTFITGDALDPADLNTLYQYSQDAIDDVSQKRYQDSFMVFPFVEDVSTPYVNTSSTEELTYRFTCPTTCIVKAAFLHANLVSSAEVTITALTGTGSLIPGASVPLLTTTSAVASASVDTITNCPDRFQLTAGVEYKFTVGTAGSNTFSLSRFDLILHVSTDRFVPGASVVQPVFTPTLLNAGNAVDATVINANNTALATQAALFASNVLAPAPLLFVKHNVVTGSTVNPRTFQIPRVYNVRGTCRIVRVYLFAVMDATTGTTVSATIKDNTGATLATVSGSVSGVSRLSVDSGALSITLASSTATVSTTTTLDYTLTLANASTTNCRKLYALVWLSR